MIDSHCHLDDRRFADDRDAVLERARTAGVVGFVVPGVDPRDTAVARTLARQEPGVRRAAGLHPLVAGELAPAERAAALEALQGELDGACALGECGLDRRTGRDEDRRARQEAALLPQLQLAREHDLPLILHVVRAHGRMLELLEDAPPSTGGILHWYSGPPDLVPRYAALGLSFGVGLALGRQPRGKAEALLAAIPGDRLLLETDAPDQPARPGERNEPAALPEVARIVADLTGREPAAVIEASDAALVGLLGDLRP